MRPLIFCSFSLLLGSACGDDADPSGGLPDAEAVGAADASQASADAGSDATAPESELPCTATIQLLDYKLEPADLTLPGGDIELCAVNAGQAPHDLGVRDANKAELGRTKMLNPGQKARLSLSLAAGDVSIFCSQPGHESLGMRGTISVE